MYVDGSIFALAAMHRNMTFGGYGGFYEVWHRVWMRFAACFSLHAAAAQLESVT